VPRVLSEKETVTVCYDISSLHQYFNNSYHLLYLLSELYRESSGEIDSIASPLTSSYVFFFAWRTPHKILESTPEKECIFILDFLSFFPRHTKLHQATHFLPVNNKKRAEAAKTNNEHSILSPDPNTFTDGPLETPYPPSPLLVHLSDRYTRPVNRLQPPPHQYIYIIIIIDRRRCLVDHIYRGPSRAIPISI
jgi:hypothetical protein